MLSSEQDPTDMFEDIPLDTRHHKFKPKIKFPREWYVTEERKKQLEAQRKHSLLLDEQKRQSGGLVDGAEIIQQALLTMKQPVEEPVLIRRGKAQGRFPVRR